MGGLPGLSNLYVKAGRFRPQLGHLGKLLTALRVLESITCTRSLVSSNTASNYRTVADHHIIPTLGTKKLTLLTTSDVDRLISKKMNGDLAVSTVKRIR